MFDEYTRACSGVTRLQQLRREATSPADPVLFWEKVIQWLPKLFDIKRTGERLVREGRRSRAEINETMRERMRHVYPPGYALGTEQEELAKARCALAEARWRRQAAGTPTSGTQQFVPLMPAGSRNWRSSSRTGQETGKRLGEYAFGERQRIRSPLTSRGPHLRFLSLDNFKHAASSLTEQLSDRVRFLAASVDASWNSTKPIVEIRLVGHTDNTGSEKLNVGLGDKRAQAVASELAKFPGVASRVRIAVEPSPGETQPTATNQTQQGRGLNRRVEVFVIFGVVPSPPPPPPPPAPPPCIDPRRCITKPPEDPIIKTKRPEPFTQPIRPGRNGKSLEGWLKEVLADLPKPIAWAIRKALITGACATLEYWLGKTVGRLNESEKDQIRKECEVQAKKPR